MKRIVLALIVGLSLLSAKSFAQEHAPAAGTAAEHAHEPAPLLPANGHEATQHFLTPAIWTLVIFIAMLVILYPTAWKNVLAGLKKREEGIRTDIAQAETARAKAEATLKEYNVKLAAAEDSIREMLNKATADGEKLATSIRMKAQAEAEEIKDRATKDIEASKDAAIRDFREYAADIATNVAEKIIRRNLNAADQAELVRQSLDQLQTVK